MAIKKTKTICTSCHARCGAIVYSEGNKITRIEGDPRHPHSRGFFCGSGLSQREIHEDPKRVIYPMKRVGPRGSGDWERISWQEAMDTIAEKTLQIKEKYGPTSIIVGQGTSRTSNHWHGRINSNIGVPGWGMAPHHVCMLPSIVPYYFTTGTFTFKGADYDNAQKMVIWGLNPASMRFSYPQMMRRKAAGGSICVIDIRYTDAAKSADIYIRPRPGTDGALALGFMHVIIKEGLYDHEFVDKWTYGFDELAARVAEFPPERVAKITWVPEEQIISTARWMASEGPLLIDSSLGVGNMHTNGIQNARAMVCLQGLLGQLDKRGTFFLEHSPGFILDPRITLWDRFPEPSSPEVKLLGGEKYALYKTISSSNWPNAVFKAVLTGQPWPVKMLVFVASDPLLSYEDTQQTIKALQSPNLDFLVVKDFYFSPTAKYADIVLPTSDWSERDTVDEEMFGPFVIPTERAVDPPGECWDDWKFFLEWGRRIAPEDWPWKDEREMVLWRLKTFYHLDLTWEQYVASDYIWTPPGGPAERPTEKWAKGILRQDHQPGFETSTGRFEFKCDAMAHFGYDPVPDYTEPAESPYSQPDLAEDYPLILSTGHRVYSFFHSAWTNVPAQRETAPYPFTVINPVDAKARNILDGDWIVVATPRGQIRSKAKVSHEVGAGVVAVPRPGWRDPCPELGLPGFGWDGANPNMLVPAEPAEPSFGSSPMKSMLCQVAKAPANLA